MRLFHLGESGFAPSLPAGYSWCLPRQRKRVRYEYPQGRRVNAPATYGPFAPTPTLDARPFERTLTSGDLPGHLRGRLPAAKVPRVVALGNAGIHASKVVKAARPGLAKLGIYLYYLPPHSPELNRIEECLELGKGECGLDECEVRSWTGWHRHVRLSLLALAVVAVIRSRVPKPRRKKGATG